MNMKHGLLLLFLVLFASASAQDVIIKRNGEEIQAKISKVSENEIEYKKWTNLEGPLYTLKTSQIFMIKYENGEKDVFDTSSNAESTAGKTAGNEYIKTSPSSNNSALIDQYNKKVTYSKYDKKGKSKSKWGLYVVNVSQTSILNDGNIEISFLRGGESILSDFTIVLKNLTDKTMLIDLGNSFKLFPDGTFLTFYDNTITTTSSNSSKGVGLNVGSVASVLGIGGVLGTLAGGVTVGGSGGETTSTTQIKERIISIPPRGVYKIEDAFFTFTGLADVIPQLKKGEELDFTEENTPLTKECIFTYSTDFSFSSYGIIKFKIFVKQAFGLFSWRSCDSYVRPQAETSLWDRYYAN